MRDASSCVCRSDDLEELLIACGAVEAAPAAEMGVGLTEVRAWSEALPSLLPAPSEWSEALLSKRDWAGCVLSVAALLAAGLADLSIGVTEFRSVDVMDLKASLPPGLIERSPGRGIPECGNGCIVQCGELPPLACGGDRPPLAPRL